MDCSPDRVHVEPAVGTTPDGGIEIAFFVETIDGTELQAHAILAPEKALDLSAGLASAYYFLRGLRAA